MIEKIVEGKMSKFYEEVCLLEQPFIKEQSFAIKDLIAQKVGKLGENMTRTPLCPLQGWRCQLDRGPDQAHGCRSRIIAVEGEEQARPGSQDSGLAAFVPPWTAGFGTSGRYAILRMECISELF